MTFKHERKGNFDFLCGLIGHVEKVCEKSFTITNDDSTWVWGPDIRVEIKTGGGGGKNKWLKEEGTGERKGKLASGKNHGMIDVGWDPQ